MGDFSTIAIANIIGLLYALGLAISLIIAMTRRNASKKRCLLLGATWFHAFAVAARLAAWLLVRHPGSLVHECLTCLLLAADVFTILTCLFVMVYVHTDVSGRSFDPLGINGLIKLLWILNGLNLVLAITNPLTHIYHYVDQMNVYHVGWAFWLRNALFFLQGICLVPVLVRLRAHNGVSMTVRLLACGSLGVISALIELLFPGVSVLFPAVSLMLALFAVSVQGRVEEDVAQLRAEAAESRLRLLSGQMPQHFVFNSLTAIKELVRENPALAEQTIQDFSDYLRSHLDAMSDTRLVPFATEIDHVRHYVSIEQADATVPLEARYDFAVEDFSVPPLTVQPLVENAIRHGVKTRQEGGVVTVSTRRTEEGVEVRVSDDGKGFSSLTARQDERRRVGLDNVRERIERQCGGTLSVETGSTGTVVTLHLPEGGES